MDSQLGQALCNVKTSTQWATLPSVVAKVNKQLDQQQQVTPRQLATFLTSVDEQEMNANGVWVCSFGPKHMPIVIANPAYARNLQAARACGDEVASCSCGRESKQGGDAERYFGSSDYNAGRHAVHSSGHRQNCALWWPPSSSHLHSWRRGFD